MNKKFLNLLIALVFIFVAGCSRLDLKNGPPPDPIDNQSINNVLKVEEKKFIETDDNAMKNVQNTKVEMAVYNNLFRFNAELFHQWQVEYVPKIESINIYDPNLPGKSLREKSIIFIRYFKASDFLTLSTVNIFSQDKTSVNGHDAVEYEIEKKSSVPDFPYQPSWRNRRHHLTDIRYSRENPTFFYVFAYSPSLPQTDFTAFLESLVFHSDQASLREPLTRLSERIIKKPFGIYITPENSPISPERFSGYHNGVDYEIFPEEIDTDVTVAAVCGGELLQKITVSGYGGLVVQSCVIAGKAVKVIYGHLRLSSIDQRPGDYLLPGEVFALLGTGDSAETDHERQHLHLGISKSAGIDLRGYVANASELVKWIDISNLINTK